MARLKEFGADVESALERVRVPAYLIDGDGIIRWLNPAGEQLFGDVRGRDLTAALAPEEHRRGREIFARNLLGPPEGSDNHGVLLNADGERVNAELSAVPLARGGHVIGVFGVVKDLDEAQPALSENLKLTPRQRDVLRLLEEGRSTQQIAGELHLSLDTVRNHIRRLLRTLGVHTRLEAVAMARRHHLGAS
jgi:PAS domain S-box-containing protein